MKHDTYYGLRLPTHLKEWMQQQADADGRSLSNWLIRKLTEMKEEKDGR